MFVDPYIMVQFTKKNPTKCNIVSKFYYSIFIWSSTCFGRHTAHHQEPKTAMAASGFAYVEGRTCRWWMSGILCKKSKFCYSIFIWSSTFFGRHTAHHKEPKTALTASGFTYVEGFWTCNWWTLSGTVCAWQRPPATHPTQSSTFEKSAAASAVFRLLMMGSVSPDNVQQLQIQQSSPFEKPAAASAVLGSWWWAVCRAKHVELHINME
jgi:hypothetical protein